MKLIFSHGAGLIDNGTTFWPITALPAAATNAGIDGIFYDDFSETYIKHSGGGQSPLSDAERAAVAAYIVSATPQAMPGPTPAQLAQQLQLAADLSAAQAAKAEPVIQYLVTHTPAECATYVANSVTNLASAVALLQKFAIALCVLSRNQLR